MGSFPIEKIEEIASTCEKIGSMIYEKDNELLSQMVQLKENLKNKILQSFEETFEKIEKYYSENGKFRNFSEKMDLVNDLKNDFEMDQGNKQNKVKLVKALRRLTHLHKEQLLNSDDVMNNLNSNFGDFELEILNNLKEYLESNLTDVFDVEESSEIKERFKDKEMFAKVSDVSEHLKSQNSKEKSVFETKNDVTDQIIIKEDPFCKNDKNQNKIISNSENCQKDEENVILSKIKENNNKMKNYFEELTKFKPIKTKKLSFIKYAQSLESKMEKKLKTTILHFETDFIIQYTPKPNRSNDQDYYEGYHHRIEESDSNESNDSDFEGQNSLKKNETSCLCVVSGLGNEALHKEVFPIDYVVQNTYISKKGKFLLVTSLDKEIYLYDILRSEENKSIFYLKSKDNKELNQKLKESIKAKLISKENKENVLFLSKKNELILCDLESESLNLISVENEVMEFEVANQSDILILKKDLEFKVFDLKKNELNEPSSNDPNQIKKFITTMIYDKKYQESKT
jgi:hypothetical protein